MRGKKMAEEKKQDKLNKDDILKALLETLVKGITTSGSQ